MPSKSKNKSKMKNNQKKSTVSKKVQPVVEQAVQPGPVVDAPVVEEPVVEESVVAAAPVKQKGGAARKGKSKKQTKTPAKATETETEQVTEAFTETATATETTETTETRNTRSFKVLLPNSSEYVGRFTGLTPYQAANKALSKYYRETNKPKKEIRFSIRESTRGSKRSVYTYNGRREKLKTPVEYSIKDGRTIVKQYKNRLIKVKKSELAVAATSSA